MSATNHTTNYELPIFIGTDKPAWLVDWNVAMTAIDTAIHTAEGKADQAGTDIGGIESSISTINSTLTSINNAVSQLRLDTNANTGSINTITELIGNGTPTTTDKTLIGAINELNADKANVDLFNLKAKTTTGTAGTHVASLIDVDVNTLVDDSGSIGKFYGEFSGTTDATGVTGGQTIATFTVTGLSTASAFNVKGYSLTVRGASQEFPTVKCMLRFNVGNTVDVIAEMNISANTGFWMTLPPCLLILKDLGD